MHLKNVNTENTGSVGCKPDVAYSPVGMGKFGNRDKDTSLDDSGLTHCKFVLVFAVLMDLLGVAALLTGVFAPLEIKGRDFGDLLVYSGALLILLSMGGWVMWYSGNIEGLTVGKELTYTRSAVDRLAHSLSRRIRRPHRSHTEP
ncbi:transmembrane protein 238a [Alosa sapidissima]|uniref:transmembrane protein 238a n=1 Tax=Alosa sapidissima TaxID=34773 RepID=UPI001C09B600|nr:transmembrane protein 238a [Alosa sapidissima]